MAEADHLLNMKSAPMSARKLRALVRSGDLRGYKHGKDTFVSASDFRAFVSLRGACVGGRFLQQDFCLRGGGEGDGVRLPGGTKV